MDTKAFRESPMGRLVPINGRDTYLGRDYSHYAFVPNPLPATVPLSERTYNRVSQASLEIGRLDFAVQRLPNPSLLVRPALRREAQSTSALEGTYAPLEDVLQGEFLEEARQSAELREILNYVRAAEEGLRLIEKRPIHFNMIAQLQKILVRGTRGDGYDAGKVRSGIVYIGERHSGIEASRFVPPPPGDELRDGISDWEKWINADNDVPLLVKAAVGHYQFETLHPFTDGNGRMGRLIASLQLVEGGALHYPVLNLSPWLREREQQYKDEMLRVSISGDLNPWVHFFCDAVVAQAQDGVKRIEAVLAVRQQWIAKLHRARVRGVAVRIADSLIGYPYIAVPEAASLHGVTYASANNAIRRLVSMGILEEITGGNYSRVFVAPQLRAIFASR